MNSAYTYFSEILTVDQTQIDDWDELEINWVTFHRIHFGL